MKTAIRRLLFLSILTVSFLLIVYLSSTAGSVNRAGAEVIVNVAEIRSLRSTIFLGLQPLWNPDKISFTAYPLVTDQGETVDWQPEQVLTDSPRKGINLDLPIDKGRGGNPIYRQVPVDIVFELPDDDRLLGQTLKGNISMSLKVAQARRSPKIVNIRKELEFEVLSKEEVEAYDAAWFSRGTQNIFKVIMYSVLILIFLIIFNALIPKHYKCRDGADFVMLFVENGEGLSTARGR